MLDLQWQVLYKLRAAQNKYLAQLASHQAIAVPLSH